VLVTVLPRQHQSWAKVIYCQGRAGGTIRRGGMLHSAAGTWMDVPQPRNGEAAPLDQLYVTTDLNTYLPASITSLIHTLFSGGNSMIPPSPAEPTP